MAQILIMPSNSMARRQHYCYVFLLKLHNHVANMLQKSSIAHKPDQRVIKIKTSHIFIFLLNKPLIHTNTFSSLLLNFKAWNVTRQKSHQGLFHSSRYDNLSMWFPYTLEDCLLIITPSWVHKILSMAENLW